jgi:hypothetical protein
MRIRDLQWKGIPAWPPEWWISDETAGEAGFLKNVQLRYDQTPPCIAVVASHLDVYRNGVILLEDLINLEILCQKLKENLGRPLSDIGDMDIDFSPALPKQGPKQVRPPRRQDIRSEMVSKNQVAK